MTGGTRDGKVIAVLLLLLLVGNEAVRVGTATTWGPGRNTPLVAEESTSLQTHKQCIWRLAKGGCYGNCQYRPLPFDRGLSASCRLSTDYMLRNNETAKTFVEQEGKRLDEAAEMVASSCSRSTSRARSAIGGRLRRCLRHGAHMVQLTRFMIQAQERVENGTLSVDFSKTIEMHVADARANLAEALGSDASYFEELMNKVQTNAVDIVKNPEQFKPVVKLMQKLASGDESIREEARKEISAMPTRSSPEPAAEEIAQIKAAAEEQKARGLTREHEMDSLDDIEKSIASLGRDTEETASALMEGNLDYKSGIGRGIKAGTVMLTVALILLAVLLLFVAPQLALIMFAEQGWFVVVLSPILYAILATAMVVAWGFS